MNEIKITVNKGQANKLDNMLVSFGKVALKPIKALKQIGIYMLGSIDKNFESEGRPVKWVPLAPSTLASRRKGKSPYGIKILSDTGILRESINFKISENGDSVAIGTNVPYAPYHQFGAPKVKKHVSIKTRTKALRILRSGKTAKAKKMVGFFKIPQRKFLLFQEEDKEAIRTILVDNLKESLK